MMQIQEGFWDISLDNFKSEGKCVMVTLFHPGEHQHVLKMSRQIFKAPLKWSLSTLLHPFIHFHPIPLSLNSLIRLPTMSSLGSFFVPSCRAFYSLTGRLSGSTLAETSRCILWSSFLTLVRKTCRLTSWDPRMTSPPQTGVKAFIPPEFTAHAAHTAVIRTVLTYRGAAGMGRGGVWDRSNTSGGTKNIHTPRGQIMTLLQNQ